jgi:hypothetical protein
MSFTARRHKHFVPTFNPAPVEQSLPCLRAIGHSSSAMQCRSGFFPCSRLLNQKQPPNPMNLRHSASSLRRHVRGRLPRNPNHDKAGDNRRLRAARHLCARAASPSAYPRTLRVPPLQPQPPHPDGAHICLHGRWRIGPTFLGRPLWRRRTGCHPPAMPAGFEPEPPGRWWTGPGRAGSESRSQSASTTWVQMGRSFSTLARRAGGAGM